MTTRGTIANAQTHCVQLPNTFAFAQGVKGLPLADADYVRFADDLIRGQGERIFAAWKVLNGTDSERMKQCAAELAPLVKAKLEPGPLKGLLFGDANRFISDLYIMLRLKAACADFMNASAQNRPQFSNPWRNSSLGWIGGKSSPAITAGGVWRPAATSISTFKNSASRG